MFYNTPASMIEKKSYRWRISFSTFAGSNSDLDKIWIFASKVKKPSMKIETSQKKIHNTYTINYPKIPTWNPIDMTFVDFRLAGEADLNGNILDVAGSKIIPANNTYTSTDSYDIQIKDVNANIKNLRTNGEIPYPHNATVPFNRKLDDTQVEVLDFMTGITAPKPSQPINLTENTDKDVYISAQTIFYQYLLKSGYNLNSKTVEEQTIFNSLLFKDTSIKHINIYELDNDGIPIEKWIVNNPVITSVDFGSLDYTTDQLMTVSVGFNYDYAELESLNLRENAIEKLKKEMDAKLQQKLTVSTFETDKLSDSVKFRQKGGDIATLVSKANEIQGDFNASGSADLAELNELSTLFGVSTDKEVSEQKSAFSQDIATGLSRLEAQQRGEEIEGINTLTIEAKEELRSSLQPALSAFSGTFSNVDLRDTPGYGTMEDVDKAEEQFRQNYNRQQKLIVSELAKEVSGSEYMSELAKEGIKSANELRLQNLDELAKEEYKVDLGIENREIAQQQSKLRQNVQDSESRLDQMAQYGTSEGQFKNKQDLTKAADAEVNATLTRNSADIAELRRVLKGGVSEPDTNFLKLLAGNEALSEALQEREASEIRERDRDLQKTLVGNARQELASYETALKTTRDMEPDSITAVELYSSLERKAGQLYRSVNEQSSKYGVENQPYDLPSRNLVYDIIKYDDLRVKAKSEEKIQEEKLEFKPDGSKGSLFVGPSAPPPTSQAVETPYATLQPPTEDQTNTPSQQSVVDQFMSFFGRLFNSNE